MQLDELFEKLWKQYTEQNSPVEEIYNLFIKQGEKVINDHIALRTLAGDKVGIDSLAKVFVALGYKEKNTYDFEVKKLNAKHFEHQDPGQPKVFISELRWQEFSPFIQETMKYVIQQLGTEMVNSLELVYSGRHWEISFETYKNLQKESEYAAWFYVHGFQANHFTINVNQLQKYDTLEKVNQLISDNGFTLNTSGGLIKGGKEEMLEQSSTMAKSIDVKFSEGIYSVPACYYEFAKRYVDASGQLYQGFVTKSADKIFESTDSQ